jgi:hypothetical protein
LLSLSDQHRFVARTGAGCGIIKLLRSARLGIRLPAISFSNCARRQSIMQALISFLMK